MSEAKIQITLLIVRQGALSSMQDLGRWNYESTEIHVKVTSCALLSLKYSFMGVDSEEWRLLKNLPGPVFGRR